jgi:hypothetical protein
MMVVVVVEVAESTCSQQVTMTPEVVPVLRIPGR